MAISMSADREMELASELDFLLEPGWSMTRLPTGFRIGPPPSEGSTRIARDVITRTASKIAEFVGIGKQVETFENDNGSVRIIIWWSSGDGSEIIIDNAANHLPDHRPRPFEDDAE